MSVADNLLKKAGGNLGESLGIRAHSPAPPASETPTMPTTSPDDGRRRAREAGYMEIDRIIPDPDQPRKDFPAESIDQLAASIKDRGILLPLRIRWNAELEKWVIISGERRYRAAKQAGLTSVPCLFIDRELTEGERLEEQLIENLLREDLRPIEKANAYEQLMKLHDWTATELCESLRVSNASVSKALALLKLPEDVQRQVDCGEIPPSAAYELTKLKNEGEQRQVAKKLAGGTLTRDEASATVKSLVENGDPPKPKQSITKYTFRTDSRTAVHVVFAKKRVRDDDIIAALQAAITQVQQKIESKNKKAA